jgi:hypothetical protein
MACNRCSALLSQLRAAFSDSSPRSAIPRSTSSLVFLRRINIPPRDPRRPALPLPLRKRDNTPELEDDRIPAPQEKSRRSLPPASPPNQQEQRHIPRPSTSTILSPSPARSVQEPPISAQEPQEPFPEIQTRLPEAKPYEPPPPLPRIPLPYRSELPPVSFKLGVSGFPRHMSLVTPSDNSFPSRFEI